MIPRYLRQLADEIRYPYTPEMLRTDYPHTSFPWPMPTALNVAIAHDTFPFVSVYPWSSSGFGTKYSNPDTALGLGGKYVEFSASGTEIAIGHSASPYISVYTWSNTGFGTKYNTPTITGSTGGGMSFGT